MIFTRARRSSEDRDAASRHASCLAVECASSTGASLRRNAAHRGLFSRGSRSPRERRCDHGDERGGHRRRVVLRRRFGRADRGRRQLGQLLSLRGSAGALVGGRDGMRGVGWTSCGHHQPGGAGVSVQGCVAGFLRRGRMDQRAVARRKRRGVEGAWTWTTGEPFSFSGGWAPGHPDPSVATRDCLVVFEESDWSWGDVDCQNYRSFLCER